MTTRTETEKARFDTRMPKEQKLLFERAASIGGYRNLSDFVILSAQEKAKQNIPILAIHIVLLYKKNTEWNYIRLLNERIQENLPKRKDSGKFQKKLVEIILP